MKAEAATFDAIQAALANPPGPTSDHDLNSAWTETAPPESLRDAGVLVALEDIGGQLHVILTQRSSALKHHPGQIAFPGGKKDATDADATAAALREAEEEIGLPRDHVEVLGHLAPHETISGFVVQPVVARVTRPFIVVPEAGEVAEVFRVPLAHVLDPARFMIHGRRWRGRTRRYYAVPWGPYYIWGATARILRAFARVMQR